MSHHFKLALLLASALVLGACEKNPLEAFGVSYEIWRGESPTFKYVRIYRTTGGVKREGPEITGTELRVRFEDVTGDGIPEIVVFSDVFSSRVVILQVDLSPGATADFKVLRHDKLDVNYPPAGLHFP